MSIIHVQLLVARMNIAITLVKKGATLGANCTIVCGVTVGAYAFIGAGSVVNRDVPDYALMVGVPARQIGWMSQFGEKLNLPLKGNADTICANTNTQYFLRDGHCFAETDVQLNAAVSN